MEAFNLPEWLDLSTLREYACVSERTVRTWIHALVDPLPASQVGKKILVRRRTFDEWIERHRVKPLDSSSIGSMVDEILEGVAR